MRNSVASGERRVARRAALRRGATAGWSSSAKRPGFTLIELLVAISIFAVVAALTIGTINISVTGDRIREAGRQVQSVIEGGRDRAIRRRQPAGVRLLVDENDPTHSQVTSFIYIGVPGSRHPRTGHRRYQQDGDTQEFTPLRAVCPRWRSTAILMLDPRLRNAVFGVGTNWSTCTSAACWGRARRSGSSADVDDKSRRVHDPSAQLPDPHRRRNGRALRGLARRPRHRGRIPMRTVRTTRSCS